MPCWVRDGSRDLPFSCGLHLTEGWHETYHCVHAYVILEFEACKYTSVFATTNDSHVQ